MYPHERSLVEKHKHQPFAIIGVNSDRDLKKVMPALKKENVSWRSFWNGRKGTGGPISRAWNVSAWPTIYLIDAEGVIRYKQIRGEALDAAIEELLAEMNVSPSDSSSAVDGSTAGSFEAPVRVKANNEILSAKGGTRFISPALHDLDGDGRAELVLGSLMGRIGVHRNLNTSGMGDPVWGPREDFLGATGKPIRTSNW